MIGKMLLVVASMQVELEGFFGLDRGSGYWSECQLVYTGMGRENVIKTFEKSNFDSEVDGLLSVGFGGATDSEVTPGELCLVERVRAKREERSYHSDQGFLERAESALGPDINSRGSLTLEDTARSPGEKQSLETSGFPVVDQETYWVAREADRRNIPFLGLRVVFDGVDQSLPPQSCYDRNSGQVHPGRVLAWTLRHPTAAVELPRLGWNSVRARSRLAHAVEAVIPALLR